MFGGQAMYLGPYVDEMTAAKAWDIMTLHDDPNTTQLNYKPHIYQQLMPHLTEFGCLSKVRVCMRHTI